MPGHLGDDASGVTEQAVRERRLAHVGAADERDPRGGVVLIHLGVVGQCLHDGVEEVARARPVDGAERVHVADAEAPQLGGLHAAKVVVGLVADDQDGLLGAAEHLSDLLVEVRDAGLDVDHEEDHVGLLQREEHLLADGGLEALGGAGHEAAGVDEIELAAAPVHLAVDPVARDAGLVVDDGVPGLGEAVEERGLAHVRAADDGDERHSRVEGRNAKEEGRTGSLWRGASGAKIEASRSVRGLCA